MESAWAQRSSGKLLFETRSAAGLARGALGRDHGYTRASNTGVGLFRAFVPALQGKYLDHGAPPELVARAASGQEIGDLRDVQRDKLLRAIHKERAGNLVELPDVEYALKDGLAPPS
jgi:hypothetical protein